MALYLLLPTVELAPACVLLNVVWSPGLVACRGGVTSLYRLAGLAGLGDVVGGGSPPWLFYLVGCHLTVSLLNYLIGRSW